MPDSHVRSMVKGISWRIVGTLDTMLLVFLFSGKLSLATLVGSNEAITKVILFWAHERGWQRIPWGRTVPQDRAARVEDLRDRATRHRSVQPVAR